MTKAVQSGAPKLEIEKAAALRQARVDRGEEVIVGVNRYRLDNEERHRRPRHRQCQGARRADRAARRGAARRATRRGASRRSLRCANMRRRTRATCSQRPSMRPAPAPRWARYPPGAGGCLRPPSRHHPRHLRRLCRRAMADDPQFDAASRRGSPRFKAGTARAPSIFIAKMGQDGHDRGAKVIATAFADLGFAVHMGDLFETPPEVAAHVAELKVDAVGRLLARRRAQDAGARTDRRAQGPRAGRGHRHRRRRHPRAGLCVPARRRRRRNLRAGHQCARSRVLRAGPDRGKAVATDDRPAQPRRHRRARPRAAARSIATCWARKVRPPQALPEHGVTVVFVDTDNTKVELMEPLGRRLADREVPRRASRRRHAPYLLRSARHRSRSAADSGRGGRARAGRRTPRSARTACRCCSFIPRISTAR